MTEQKYPNGTKLKVMPFKGHSPDVESYVGKVVVVYHSQDYDEAYEIDIPYENFSDEAGFIPAYIEDEKKFKPYFDSWKEIIEG